MSHPQPIVNLGAFDVVGVRKDGGIDLAISCAGPLDSSPGTLSALRAKITNYLYEVRNARNPTLFERYKCSATAAVRIIISCDFPVDPVASVLVDEMKEVARASNIELRWAAEAGF